MCVEACSYVCGFEDWRDLQLSAQIRTVVFCRKLNKTQFYGCNPYTGGEPHYIWCCGSLCCLCYVLSCINKYISDK